LNATRAAILFQLPSALADGPAATANFFISSNLDKKVMI
jgi:hypothetical protein